MGFLGFLSKLETVYEAESDSDREEVFALRYRVYVEELKKGFLQHADHERRWLRDPEDDRPNSTILFTRSKAGITGTLRVDAYPVDSIPTAIATRFSLHQLPTLPGRTVCELGRLVIAPEHRGLLILPALARKAYEISVDRYGARCGFNYCAPGLVGAYRRLGFRPYPGDLIFNQDGVRVPMMFVADDLAYHAEVGAPFLDEARRRFASTRDDTATNMLAPILQADTEYFLDQSEVWEHLQTFLASRTERPSFMDGLSARSLAYLSEHGFVVSVPAGKRVIRDKLVESEAFIVLAGAFEVRKGDRRVAVIGRGEIFGELAFFLDSQARTADVFSVCDSTVLILRRKYLEQCIKDDPEIGNELLMAICRTLARRLAVPA